MPHIHCTICKCWIIHKHLLEWIYCFNSNVKCWKFWATLELRPPWIFFHVSNSNCASKKANKYVNCKYVFNIKCIHSTQQQENGNNSYRKIMYFLIFTWFDYTFYLDELFNFRSWPQKCSILHLFYVYIVHWIWWTRSNTLKNNNESIPMLRNEDK